MPDVKISALPAATVPLAGTEVLPIVQSATTRQVSVANLTAGRSVGGTDFIPSGSSAPTNGMYLPAANTLGFSTNSTAQMRITSAGAVGIGATSVSAQLHVQNANGNSGLGSDNTGMALVESTYASNGPQANASFIAKNYYGFTQLMQWQNFGVRFGSRSTANGGAGELIFTYGNDSEGMRIDASGRLAVGTSSPQASYLVTLNGTDTIFPAIYLDNTTNSKAYSIRATGTNFVIRDNTASADRLTIDTSGIVTMGAYGAGAATFSAAGVISSVSDETWKTKDGVPTNTDAMLQKLEPGYWFYNEEKAPTFGQERQLGFYAQNVHEAIGEEAAPTPQEGKPWGYHDRSVLAIAVMSLKNALTTIEELKQKITALENK